MKLSLDEKRVEMPSLSLSLSAREEGRGEIRKGLSRIRKTGKKRRRESLENLGAPFVTLAESISRR